MQAFKHLLQPFIFKSLAPLTICGTLYILNGVLTCFFDVQIQLANKSGNNSQEQEKNISVLNLLDVFTQQFIKTVLEAYSSFPQFIFMMLIITIILKFLNQPLKTFRKEKSDLKSIRYAALLKAFLSYSLIYCCYQTVGAAFLNISSRQPFTRNESQQSILTIHRDTFNFHTPHQNYLPTRMLEEIANPQCAFQTHVSAQEACSEHLSLSVGHHLATIPISGGAIITSKDGKLLYHVDYSSLSLTIVDITNIKEPIKISNKDLDFEEGHYWWYGMNAAIYLSEDGKTLFTSNFRSLHIIDVSNPKSPFVIAFLDNFNLDVRHLQCQPTMEVSKDKKTLFVAGEGLQVFDISSYHTPILRASIINKKNPKRSSLALSQSDTYLLYANGTLQIYDILNPKNLTIVKNFEEIKSAISLILTHDKQTAYILCNSKLQPAYLEKVNVSDPTAPSRIKSYRLNFPSRDSDIPAILTISPCNRYIFLSGEENQLRVFDTIDEKISSHNRSLLQSATAMIFIPNTTYLASTSISISHTNRQVTKFFELFPNFLQGKTFTRSEDSIENSFIKFRAISLDFSIDRQVIFVLTGCDYDPAMHPEFKFNGTLELVNISNFSSNVILSSYVANKPIRVVKIDEKNTRAVLGLNSEIRILDISNFSSPFEIRSIDCPKDISVLDLFLLKDSHVLIAAFGNDTESPVVRIFNISNTSIFSEISSFQLSGRSYQFKMVLSKNEKVLFLVDRHLSAYDISNLSNPSLIYFSDSLDKNKIFDISSCLLSPEGTILALRLKDDKQISKLKFFNVSNLTQPISTSEVILPRSLEFFRFEEATERFQHVFSVDQKLIYLYRPGGLLVIDISDLNNPKIFGMLPNSALGKDGNHVSVLNMDPDGEKINVLTYKGDMFRMNIQSTEILYLKQDIFGLGERYSDFLYILKRNEMKEYDLLDRSHHNLIKNYVLNLKISGHENSTKITTSRPYWMDFDREESILTIEPKSQTDISSYTLCSSFSYKIPTNAFRGLEASLPNSTDSEELLATLISIGYLDNQLFITSNFGSLDAFFLPRLYRGFENAIFEIIKMYFREVCRQIEIVSSLELEKAEKLIIKTISQNTVKVEIEVESHGRFLSKPYGLLQPVVGRNGSAITFEGSLKEVNSVLTDLVLDLTLEKLSCSGNITINDHLNPPLIKEINSISNYFTENKEPVLNANENMTVQYQIDQVFIYTGQYFTIPLNENTFIDYNSDKLSYSITPNPSWLSFNNLVLKGTPPEELFARDIDLFINVTNQFKYRLEPFKLHIRISPMFAVKLLIKNSPYILTILGLIIYFNKICNILFKKSYKHPQEYSLKIEESITSNIIFPVFFIEQENQEKELILKYLPKVLSKELQNKSPSKYQIVSHFVDQLTGKLDRILVNETIKEAVNLIPQKMQSQLSSYCSKNLHQKEIVIKLVTNTLIDWQLDLNQETATKNIFNQIKCQCFEFVELTSSETFIINQPALQKVLENSLCIPSSDAHSNSTFLSENDENNNLKGTLLNEFSVNKDSSNHYNKHLLEDACISYVFKQQSVFCLDINANILLMGKIPSNLIFRFLKKDLLEIGFQDKGKIDYGFDYKIQNSTLYFYGSPTQYFSGKTVVVQIVDRKHRILKELWIHGRSHQFNQSDQNNSFHQNYEVL